MGCTCTANKGKKSKQNFCGETSFTVTIWMTVEDNRGNIQVAWTQQATALQVALKMCFIYTLCLSAVKTYAIETDLTTATWQGNNRGLDNAFNDMNLTYNLGYVIIPVIFSKSITFK